VTNARELPELAPTRDVLEDGERIKTSRVVNEAVARIGDGHDPREKAVSALEPRGVLFEGADEPLSDRAQPNDDDSHFVYRHGAMFVRCAARSPDTASRCA
jgi:hypothetical protein